jgi:sterol desaturase/sphingolipid hydroxylase (fatty acid hydroxylase superfamily)
VNALVTHEAWVRAAAFAAVLATCLLVERRWPVRGDARPARRQAVNLALVVTNTAVLRLAFPLLAVALALRVEARDGGLLGAVAWPRAVEIVAGVLALDLAIYWQHRLMHRIPLLWPLHRVHHSDLAIDATTGVRFHPLEIVLSMGIKLGVVALLGPPAVAVVLFEVLLSAGSLVTHTDVALPARAEPVVRALLVTPSMHRIHHSLRRDETDSNYGFTTSLWDRLFQSHRARPLDDEATMPIGLDGVRDPSALGWWALLLQPGRRLPARGDSCDKGRRDA